MAQYGLHLGTEAATRRVQEQTWPQLRRGAAALDTLHQYPDCRLAFARMQRQHEQAAKPSRDIADSTSPTASARWIIVAVPPGRAIATMKRAHLDRFPPGITFEAVLSISTETVPAPSGLKGGLAST